MTCHLEALLWELSCFVQIRENAGIRTSSLIEIELISWCHNFVQSVGTNNIHNFKVSVTFPECQLNQGKTGVKWRNNKRRRTLADQQQRPHAFKHSHEKKISELERDGGSESQLLASSARLSRHNILDHSELFSVSPR